MPRLDSDHLLTLTEGVSVGYNALNAIMASTPVLEGFWPGRNLRSYLVDPCVQYGIEVVSTRRGTFHTEFKPNKAGNHVHTRFHGKGVCITTHFTGQDASRKAARRAVNRAELASRCQDLFAFERNLVVLEENQTVYVHLLHGGKATPVALTLAIPDQSQSSYPLTPWALDLTAPETADVEQVTEAMTFRLKQLPAESEDRREAS